MSVRLRFAPSPTGYLHIGGLRTALYNYFFTENQKGTLILRIEDTDQSRYVEGAIESLIESLDWSGLEYQEGVYVNDEGEIYEKGDYGPYIQSDRVKDDLYTPYVNQLLDQGDAYYCFCSRERLDQVREAQRADGLIPRYDEFCRGMDPAEAKARVEAGEEHVIRMKLPHNTDVSFDDLVKGKITINTRDMDDQVLIKADGYPTYHFAVVVDDHLMEISHIVRGDEWIPSTPKHVLLYQMFDWPMPEYVHLPTVLNKERKKLSKRNDDVAVEDFIEQGYLPGGLVNYLALVGWAPRDTEEILSMDDLIRDFSYDRVSKTGGVFDRDKLDWVNAHYIRALTDEELGQMMKPYMIKAGFIGEDFPAEKLTLMGNTFKDSIEKLDEVPEKVAFVFAMPELDEEAQELIKEDHISRLIQGIKDQLVTVDEVDEDFANNLMKNVQEATGIKGKNLFMPSRVLMTGMRRGPELTNVIQLLGKEEIIKRLDSLA